MGSGLSSTKQGDFNGWNAVRIRTNVFGIDVTACGCSSAGLVYDNGPLFSANGDGQRIVMFDQTGAIVDAVAYCSQAGANITSGLYSDDPDGCGAGTVGSAAGAQPEGLAYTWGTCGGFPIPNPGGCTPPASATLPARGNAAYEIAAFCLGGCSSSLSRQTDNSATWVDDNSPTPGRANNSSAGDVVASCSSGTCAPTNFSLKNYNIRQHQSDNFTDAVTVCSGNPFTITFYRPFRFCRPQ
ncbi:MAG: hypothetical protein IPN94_20735 [Sphingobacteriales bacterium]|nr:hypothetical protein [Sphingobacteriales bacterium]